MLRRRLLRRVLAYAAREPGAGRNVGIACLGLSDERLRELAVRHRFGLLASSFRRIGEPIELRRVAWWGSALADIACAAGSRGRDEGLLADAARFYLAVALFDDVVDEAPERAPALAAPLHPSRLRLKLQCPTSPSARLECAASDLELIVALFDDALEGIGRRFGAEPSRREEIGDMLEAMYRSELALSGDPMPAKTLPFTLIGHLALIPGEADARTFFARLAKLLALWDDWQDLAADGWAGAANAHLAHAAGRTASVAGLARGLWLALMGAIPAHPVSRRLTSAFDEALASAGPLPHAARAKAHALLLYMLGAAASSPALIGQPPGARARVANRGRASGTARPDAPGSA
ncbi:MAG: hypothetical protein ACHQM7_03895 [Vicinamibacterales bacterium]